MILGRQEYDLVWSHTIQHRRILIVLQTSSWWQLQRLSHGTWRYYVTNHKTTLINVISH